MFFNQGSVVSYARARLKSWSLPEHLIRKQLAPGGVREREIAEGGAWWLHVQEWIASQSNDKARLEEMKPMLDAQKQKVAAMTAMLRG